MLQGNALFDQIVEVLVPYLGQTSARASVGVHLKQAGVPPDKLLSKHLDDLARRLEPGLRVFVGGLTAKMLSRRILMLGGSDTLSEEFV